MAEKESLVAMGKEVTPVPGGTVEVTAPSDLPGGYLLQVNVNGQVTEVKIPEGGVKEGQTFQAIPSGFSIPRGQWRDGLCNCCAHGCCEPMCCLGLCFQPILTGQVMTRMSRDWCGFRGEPPSRSNTCRIVTYIFLGAMLLQSVLGIVMESQGFCLGGELQYDFDTGKEFILCPNGSREAPNATYSVLNGVIGLIGTIFGVYIFLAICRTRQATRDKFNIPPGACGACDDCCCTLFCSFCTLTQMARHTHDYHNRPIQCCSGECFNKRGQPEDVPEIEV